MSKYTLEVNGQASNLSTSRSPISVDNLLDNHNYTFSIIVLNAVGNVSTNKTKICESPFSINSNSCIHCSALYIDTTDVQMIRAVPLEDSNAFMLQCNFINGSDAQGCMVVVVSQFGNVSRNLTRNSTHVTGIINVTHPFSCFNKVVGFDIESDRSVGTLAVPGVLVMNISTAGPCMPSGLKLTPGEFTLNRFALLAASGQWQLICIHLCSFCIVPPMGSSWSHYWSGTNCHHHLCTGLCCDWLSHDQEVCI